VTVFVLALLVGVEFISKVPATPHTPLMSGANSIHGIAGRRDAHHGNSPRSPRIRVEANGTSGGELGPGRSAPPVDPRAGRVGSVAVGRVNDVSTVARTVHSFAGTHHDDGVRAGRVTARTPDLIGV